MAIQGVPKFDGVVLMEIGPIDFRQGQSPALTAKGAYVNLATGDTYGSTTCRQFSQNTRLKLQELKDAMEQDLASLVFDTQNANSAVDDSAGAAPKGGIAEYLASGGDASDREADSV